MELIVLDETLTEKSVLDIYESSIWTERYYGYGDFEIYTQATPNILETIKQDYFLVNPKSERVMIVEKIQITSDAEQGDHVTITGRSIESILDRRIIWGQKTVYGNIQEAINSILDENIISPVNTARKIPNFVFKPSADTNITNLAITAQYTGDNVYDVISNICCECNIGFKILINSEKNFVFELYSGIDRSYDQTINPYVVFSPDFDNLLNSSYIESKSSLKNVTLIGGEGEGSLRKYASVITNMDEVSGLSRRELFTDARDISSNVENDIILNDVEYAEKLEQRGKEKLYENTTIVSFEGKMDSNIMYTYGTDFFLGDIVQIEDEYGHTKTVEILEMVFSESEEGISVYPTFKTSYNAYSSTSDSGNVPLAIPQTIPNGTDLDSLISVGIYQIYWDAVAASCPHIPYGLSGILEVKKLGGFGVIQIYTTYRGQIFIREKYISSDFWSSWYQSGGEITLWAAATAAGNGTQILLSDLASNYRYLEIHWNGGYGRTCTKAQSAESISLSDTGWVGAPYNFLQNRTATISISGDLLTFSGVYFTNLGSDGTGSGPTTITIYKIVGYR